MHRFDSVSESVSGRDTLARSMWGLRRYAHTATTEIIHTAAPHTDTTVPITLQAASSLARARGSMATMAVVDIMAEGQPFTGVVDTSTVADIVAVCHFAAAKDSEAGSGSRAVAALTAADSEVLAAPVAAVGPAVMADTAAGTGNPTI